MDNAISGIESGENEKDFFRAQKNLPFPKGFSMLLRFISVIRGERSSSDTVRFFLRKLIL